MKRAILLSCIAGAVLYSHILAAAPRTVAVVNFTNHTGGKGLQYLSNSLPESLSASLAQAKGIQVAERGQIAAIISEIALSQTGLFDEQMVTGAGTLVKADVLILGSYSGNPENIILTVKAVEVATGRVLDGRVVQAPLAELFDVASQAVLSMAAVISGENLGILNVSTTPDGADVYVDGMLAGKSPLVDYKLAVGTHRLKAVKRGFMDADTKLSIEKDARESWTPVLGESRVRNRSEIGLGVSYLRPTYKELDPAPMFTFFLGHTYSKINISGEFAYAVINHNQDIDTPFGMISQERWYRYMGLSVHAAVLPFETSGYVTPYAGVFAGYSSLMDFRTNKSESNNDEKLASQNLWHLGAKLGMTVAPFAKVALFLEGRFYYYPAKVTREVFESQGILGGLKSHETEYSFNHFTIGGGVKYFFQ